jgi:hypothetical protein
LTSVFPGVTNATKLYIYDQNATMAPTFAHCTFSNCVNCITGYAQSVTHGSPAGPWAIQPTLNIRVTNSRFQASRIGVYIYTDGNYGQGLYSRAWSNPTIENNIFDNLSSVAVWLDAGNYAGSSLVKIFNNLFKQCLHLGWSFTMHRCEQPSGRVLGFLH